MACRYHNTFEYGMIQASVLVSVCCRVNFIHPLHPMYKMNNISHIYLMMTPSSALYFYIK